MRVITGLSGVPFRPKAIQVAKIRAAWSHACGPVRKITGSSS